METMVGLPDGIPPPSPRPPESNTGSPYTRAMVSGIVGWCDQSTDRWRNSSFSCFTPPLPPRRRSQTNIKVEVAEAKNHVLSFQDLGTKQWRSICFFVAFLSHMQLTIGYCGTHLTHNCTISAQGCFVL